MKGMGKRITELRKAKGWSQEELGGKLGVSRQTVSKWEIDQAMPSYKNIQTLSELFGVPTEYFFSDGVTEAEPSAIQTEQSNTREEQADAQTKEPIGAQTTDEYAKTRRRAVRIFMYAVLSLLLLVCDRVIVGVLCIVFSPNRNDTTAQTTDFSNVEWIAFGAAMIVLIGALYWFVFLIITRKKK